ncbi:MAG: polysaccharide deacetylase family protein [Bacteroidota bacterium]
MLIFVDKITERLIYTLDFIFKDRGILYELTNDWASFKKSEQKKFIYSDSLDEENLKIFPSTVLFDEVIFDYAISKAAFFKEECLTFDKINDPFASIFYVLSRMEEYTVKQRDFHERFEAKNSILYKYSFLDKVICDRWSVDIIAFLEEKLACKLNPKIIPTKLIPSFDIDNTFAFQWKDGLRKTLGTWKDKIKKDKLRIEARANFEAGKITDPYDTFDEIKSLKEKGFDTKIFWLLGENSKYDKNISGADQRHQNLIQEMSKFAEIGLHPSYESNKSSLLLKNEHILLQQILKADVKNSRQHFLKLTFPATYNNLISLGFTDDFTMGYADEFGFRAGTCRSFLFFDLIKNTPTSLRVHPFAYMDGTLNQYLKLSPEEAKIKIQALYDEVKNFGGDFIFLWHNETISEFGVWKNWKSVFDFTLNLR